MNIYFEIRIKAGVFSVQFNGGNFYSFLPFSKRFGDEKLARELLADLQMRLSDHRSLFDFLQKNFGYEEFDVCNLGIDGLFKITEEKLK
jgi:hypothetical protein